MARQIHLSHFDPDFRRTPATSDFCWRCQKDLKPGQPRRWLVIVGNGSDALHPSCFDQATIEDRADFTGMWAVGADCARTMKKLTGEEWTLPLAI